METIKLNITQLNTLIKRIIDAEDFLRTISVYGEVSNFKISGQNAYFDIKEEGAQLSCIKFSAENLTLKNGDMVLLTGRLNYYVKTGKLSFIASTIEPYGLGELYKKYIELKNKLQAEGLFDERFKKQIPRYSQNVGVITSETGAVIRDIIHVARKKNPYTNIIVFPAKVQGENADDEIIAGLDYFENSNVDVVIIARGGGSFEDLSPFNSEKLARKIFSCKKPIISAVGHETDFSLSDFVADMRAPTPSVAGEIAFFDYYAERQTITDYINFLLQKLDKFEQENKNNILSLLENVLSKISENQAKYKLQLTSTINGIVDLITQKTASTKLSLNKVVVAIEKLNPLSLLSSGYAMVEKDGQKINSKNKLKPNDNINIIFSDGSVSAKVIGEQK